MEWIEWIVLALLVVAIFCKYKARHKKPMAEETKLFLTEHYRNKKRPRHF